MRGIAILLLTLFHAQCFAQISQKSLFDSLTNMRSKSINLLSCKMKLYLSDNNKFISNDNGLFVYKKSLKGTTYLKSINLLKVSKYDTESMSGANLLKTSIFLSNNNQKPKMISASFSTIVFFSPNSNEIPYDFDFSLEEGLSNKISKVLFSLATVNSFLNDKNEFNNLFNRLKKKELVAKNKPTRKETMDWLAFKMKTYLSGNFIFSIYQNGLFIYRKYNYNVNSITIYTIDLNKVLSYDNYAMHGNGVYKHQFYSSYKGMKETEKLVRENPDKNANYYNTVYYSNGNGYMTASLCDIDINQESGLQQRFQEALKNLISLNDKKPKNEKF